MLVDGKHCSLSQFVRALSHVSALSATAEDDELFFDTLLIWEFETLALVANVQAHSLLLIDRSMSIQAV